MFKVFAVYIQCTLCLHYLGQTLKFILHIILFHLIKLPQSLARTGQWHNVQCHSLWIVLCIDWMSFNMYRFLNSQPSLLTYISLTYYPSPNSIFAMLLYRVSLHTIATSFTEPQSTLDGLALECWHIQNTESSLHPSSLFSALRSYCMQLFLCKLMDLIASPKTDPGWSARVSNLFF